VTPLRVVVWVGVWGGRGVWGGGGEGRKEREGGGGGGGGGLPGSDVVVKTVY